MEEKMLNADALGYLDEAMFTSSLISKKEREAKETDWKNVYPRTKAETEQMESLLQKANAVVEDATNQEYSERYKALSEVVDWSKKRHASWTWKLIAGALLGAGIFYYFYYDQQKDIAQAKVDQEQVNQWKEISVEEVPYSVCPTEHAKDDYAMRLTSAEKYKIYKLIDLKSRALKDSAQYAALRADYDSLNAMGFRQIHEVALADLDEHVSSQETWHTLLYVYMAFLLVLIPIYIITGYPRGYTITHRNNRRGCLNIFRKVGMAVAMFCLGASVASTLLPDYVVRNTDANGKSTENKEHKWFSGLLIVLRLILMVVGAVLLCLVASIVMTVESIGGLIDMFRKCK